MKIAEVFNPDVFLFLAMLGFTSFGWMAGAIHAVGSVVGTVAGAYVATHYNNGITEWLLTQVNFPVGTAHVLVFFSTFFIVNRLVGMVFWMLDKSLNIMRSIPFLNSINHFLGGLAGFLEGALVLGLGIAYLSAFPFGEGMKHFFEGSTVAPWLVDMAAVLFPLLPEAWEHVEHLFEHKP
ncbi:MAG: CvpA family protein [Patescibacteria group bacterium]